MRFNPLYEALVVESFARDTEVDPTEGIRNFTTQLGEWVDVIKGNCSEYLTRGGGVLIRGSKTMDHTAGGRREVRKNRIPRDATTDNQLLWDLILTDIGAPKRSESMFAYSLNKFVNEDYIPGGYGAAFVVFPVGKYTSSHFTQVYDMLDDHCVEIPYDILDLVTNARSYTELVSDISEYARGLDDLDERQPVIDALISIKYVYGNLENTLVLDVPIGDINAEEITISCGEYIYIPVPYSVSPREIHGVLCEYGLAPNDNNE